MRATFAQLDQFAFKLKTASILLGISQNTIRSYIKDSGIKIQRQVSIISQAPQARQFSLDNIFQLASWRRRKRFKKGEALMPIFIAISSMKAGVGKSTTAAELSIQLQLSGQRVLMIDLDSDGKLTQYMGYEPDFESDEATENNLSPTAIVQGTFFDICKVYLTGKKPNNAGYENFAKYTKWPFGIHGPALIPSDPFLGYFEREGALSKDRPGLFFSNFFQDACLGKVPGLQIADFDVVIFDCPSSRTLTVSNALAIADYVVVPVRLDSFAKKGIAQMVSEVTLSTSKSAGAPELIFLPTHRSDINQKAIRMWKRLHSYKKSLSDISIGTTDLFTASQNEYVPLSIKLPESSPVMEYRDFTNYLLQKFSVIKTVSSS